MQEVQRRKIVVGDKAIAAAIHDRRGRNGFACGGLQQSWRRTASASAPDRSDPHAARLGSGAARAAKRTGEYQRRIMTATSWPGGRQAGIPCGRDCTAVPVEDPAASADAGTLRWGPVIAELRRGRVPGGCRAVQPEPGSYRMTNAAGQGEPATRKLRLVAEMPVGAINNPVKVPGGFSIVTLQGKARYRPRDGRCAVAAPGVPAVHRQQYRQLNSRSRRWKRQSRFPPACTAANEMGRPTKRTTRLARPIRSEVRLRRSVCDVTTGAGHVAAGSGHTTTGHH